MKKRLQVILAHAGIASRRKAAYFIENGKVRVNGILVREKGVKADPSVDRIEIDGRRINLEKKVYYVLNKPKGIITTASDEKSRRTVLNLVPDIRTRVYSVGRLDKDTEGVIILTNDGELAFRLTHPKFGVKKIYFVEVKGRITDADIKKLGKGINIEGKRTSPCRIDILRKTPDKTALKIQLHEGRKRQIRRMIEKIGGEVAHLERIEYAGIRADGLARGGYRHLRKDEISRLKKEAGIIDDIG